MLYGFRLVPMYNHSFKKQPEYIMDFDDHLIYIQTSGKLKAGEELTINYNGDWK